MNSKLILFAVLNAVVSEGALRNLHHNEGPPPQNSSSNNSNSGSVSVSCPSSGGYTGDASYIGKGPQAAPLRGTVACVDHPVSTSNLLIYGPMEAGFTNDQLSSLFQCSNPDASIIGGLDTHTAQEIAQYLCNESSIQLEILDSCGGHADPYHYHEDMNCLYTQDPVTNHSTRVGTALDGNGIYGKYIEGGVIPTDLDACGGRYGITPDSNNETVYYYVIQSSAPFTVGCFGPVSSVDECRSLYSTCGDGDEVEVTTAAGTTMYDPDCPCFDSNGSNLGSSSSDSTTTTTPSPSQASNTASALLLTTTLTLASVFSKNSSL